MDSLTDEIPRRNPRVFVGIHNEIKNSEHGYSLEHLIVSPAVIAADQPVFRRGNYFDPLFL